MSDCKCDVTEATSTPCVPIIPSTGCSSIRMFFGEYIESGSNYDSIIPGKINNLYYTNEIDDNHIKYGFKIEDYSAQELVDSGILKNGFGKLIGGNASNFFDLTEIELLAAGTWESWITWLAAECVAIPKNQLYSTSDFRSFGFYCLRDIGVDLQQLRVDGWKMFQQLKDGDPKAFYSGLQKVIVNAPQTSSSQDARGEYYQTSFDKDSCEYIKRASDVEKLVICYEWLKNIHDTYYGKQFLVRIGEPVPSSGTPVNSPLDTICIKDENGEFPSILKPYYIDGDGSAQGYTLSDVIDNSGGFPDRDDSYIIGLNNLDWIQTESGKIGSFVRIGPYSKQSLENPPCTNFYEQIKYKKFTRDGTNCENWKIDLSKLNPDSFYLASAAAAPDSAQYLYLSCSVSEKFYVDNNGTWVHITLADRVPTTKLAESSAQGWVMMDLLLAMLDSFKTNPIDTAFNIIKNPFGVGVGILYEFFKFTTQNNDNHGARPDGNILNLGNANPFCITPEAVVIPFKSNIYKYGPYSYGDSNAGGVDVIFDDDIAPWNFIKANQDSLPIDYTYDDMDDMAKAMASGSPRDLQKLEKGRITVAGLPCYCLAHWVDNPTCYNDNELGPTLLTDISVEYGSGGFNTTYNFSTYTPRLGRSEKYITQSWKDSIKDTQYLNKYLRTLETQIDRNNQSYKLRLINGERGGNILLPSQNLYYGPNLLRKSTADSIMFSGYYLQVTPNPSPDFDNYNIEEQYEIVPSNYPEDSYCGEYVCTTPTPITYTPIVHTPLPNRLYTFAETDKAYSPSYIQNTYHQLSGMSLDGFHLPVSLRGANKDPRIKEYLKYDNDEEQPNQFILSSDKLQYNPSWENNARVPRFAKRCNNNGEFAEWDEINVLGGEFFTNANTPGYPIPSKTRDEIPPFKLNGLNYQTDHNEYCYGLDINQKYLNPFLSEKNLLGATPPFDNIHAWDDRKNNSTKGFVISSILFGQDHIDYQITHTNPDATVGDIEAKDTDEFIRQQFKNFRFPAMRGPLVLQGWGYDTSGKPIPNSADGYGHAQMGEFRKENLTDKFMQNWLQNPKSWPVGPVDLRFDRERGVWTCPSPNKIVVARLKERLNKNGSAKAELINPEADGIRFYENYSISGPNGENVKLNMEHTEITVYDFLGIELCQCDVVYAYYDDNRYIVLESNRSYMDPNEVCVDILCTTTTPTTTTPTETTPPCDWCGLECLQGVPNYDSSVEQVLGHDNKGCLKWFDVTECETSPPTPPTPPSCTGTCSYFYDVELGTWSLIGNSCSVGCDCSPNPMNPPPNPEEVPFFDTPC